MIGNEKSDVLDVIEICPVAFEIFERLKKEYRFGAHRQEKYVR